MSASSPDRLHSERPSGERRILALVLPDLLVELAERKRLAARSEAPRGPLAVVLETAGAPSQQLRLDLGPLTEDEPRLPSTEKLAAVNAAARRFGVAAGQTIAQASSLVSQLVVCPISAAEVTRALGSIAEVGMAFGATVSIGEPDTVWVDVTGSAHLFGDEPTLAADLASQVRELGHRVRVAISGGPELSRAFARWSLPSPKNEQGVWVVPSSRTAALAAELPLTALPLPSEERGYFARLGLLTVGDFARQPRSALGPRLGKAATRILEFCEGRDDSPLVPYSPPRTVSEESSWDEPVAGTEPLGFVLRGLAARVAARLEARGEAAESLHVTLHHDRATARFHGAPNETELTFKLASPLHREAELRRIVASRLERLQLPAPTVGMSLEVPRLVPAVSRQLTLTELFQGDTTGAEQELPILLAELTADIGEERVGVLSLIDAHRPEARSALAPALPHGAVTGKRKRSRRTAPAAPRAAVAEAPIWGKLANPPTRLLPEPIELTSVLSVEATLLVGRTLYTIERLRFEQRLEAVEWWSRPVARDYLRLWLKSESGGIEALVFVDRQSGRRFLQAVGD